MANNVVVQVAGGSKKVVDGLSNVSDAKKALDLDSTYTAAINGNPATDSSALGDSDYVTFSKSVKGGV